MLEKINDIDTRIVANAEREVLKVLEGDCDTAVGVFAKIIGEIAPTYFVAISALVAAYFGANAYADKKK